MNKRLCWESLFIAQIRKYRKLTSGCCSSLHWFGLHTVGQHIQATGNQKTRDSRLPLPDASVDLPEPQTFLL